jgi:hypothetical protein
MVATTGVLLTLISSLTMVDMFTSAKALTQNTTQGTVCTGYSMHRVQYAQVTLVQQLAVSMVHVRQ